MKGKISLLAIGLSLIACSDKEPIDPELLLKLTAVEASMLDKQWRGFRRGYSNNLIAALSDRSVKPDTSEIPFCREAKYLKPETLRNGKVDKDTIHSQLTDTFGTDWHRCVQSSRFPNKSFKEKFSLNTDPLVDVEMLDTLTDIAKECNIAKVTLIARASELTTSEAKTIIRDCKVFKLQQELQK